MDLDVTKSSTFIPVFYVLFKTMLLVFFMEMSGISEFHEIARSEALKGHQTVAHILTWLFLLNEIHVDTAVMTRIEFKSKLVAEKTASDVRVCVDVFFIFFFIKLNARNENECGHAGELLVLSLAMWAISSLAIFCYEFVLMICSKTGQKSPVPDSALNVSVAALYISISVSLANTCLCRYCKDTINNTLYVRVACYCLIVIIRFYTTNVSRETQGHTRLRSNILFALLFFMDSKFVYIFTLCCILFVFLLQSTLAARTATEDATVGKGQQASPVIDDVLLKKMQEMEQGVVVGRRRQSTLF